MLLTRRHILMPDSPELESNLAMSNENMIVGQRYEEPTVLLAKRVTGEEEVPEGCVAVVTPDAPDVLSHVSVRARNMRVLFAICHEEQPLKDIEALDGKVTSLSVHAVLWMLAHEHR